MGKMFEVEAHVDEVVTVSVNIVDAFKQMTDEEKQEAIDELFPGIGNSDQLSRFLDAIDKTPSNFHVVKTNLSARHKEILKRLIEE